MVATNDFTQGGKNTLHGIAFFDEKGEKFFDLGIWNPKENEYGTDNSRI